MKKASTAFLFWILGFLGLCGLHRFYVGRKFTGFIWLVTLGILGFGQLFDLFFLGSMVRQANILEGLARGAIGNTNTNSVNTAIAPVFNISLNVPAGQAGYAQPDSLGASPPATPPAH